MDPNQNSSSNPQNTATPVPEQQVAHSSQFSPPVDPTIPTKGDKKSFLKSKILIIVVTVIGLLVLSAGAYWAFFNFPKLAYDKMIEDCISKGGAIGESYPPTCITTTSSADPTVDWETYRNLGVTFKYPSNSVIKQDNSNATQDIVDFTINGNIIRFDRSVSKEGRVPPYQETTITKDFNGLIWKVSVPDKDSKYCDSGDCASVPPSYYTFKDGYLYSFIYFKDDLKETTDQILSTFKFTNEDLEKPVISTPEKNTEITSPLVVEGTAPAGWMFEGQLIIKLMGSERDLIAQGVGKEKIPGSWQSGKSAEFSGNLTFTTSEAFGFLIIEADNPSGLSENAKIYEVPVIFK